MDSIKAIAKIEERPNDRPPPNEFESMLDLSEPLLTPTEV